MKSYFSPDIRLIIEKSIQTQYNSVSDFSNSHDISRSNLVKYLSGKKDITTSTLLSYLKVLDIEMILKPPE